VAGPLKPRRHSGRGAENPFLCGHQNLSGRHVNDATAARARGIGAPTATEVVPDALGRTCISRISIPYRANETLPSRSDFSTADIIRYSSVYTSWTLSIKFGCPRSSLDVPIDA
jgi:hypothetical protein